MLVVSASSGSGLHMGGCRHQRLMSESGCQYKAFVDELSRHLCSELLIILACLDVA